MTDTPTVMVDQAIADEMYDVLYSDTSTPEEVWDVIAKHRGPIIDAGVSGCNDGTFIGSCGVTHFGAAIVGHMYHSTILDRVSQILRNEQWDPGSRNRFALDFIDHAFEVMGDRMAKLTEERESRAGKY